MGASVSTRTREAPFRAGRGSASRPSATYRTGTTANGNGFDAVAGRVLARRLEHVVARARTTAPVELAVPAEHALQLLARA